MLFFQNFTAGFWLFEQTFDNFFPFLHNVNLAKCLGDHISIGKKFWSRWKYVSKFGTKTWPRLCLFFYDILFTIPF